MRVPSVPPRLVPVLATAAVAGALYAAGCFRYPNFTSARVLVSLVADEPFLWIAAVGATFVILTGGIDLSVGAVVACTSILVAALVEAGLHPLLAISIALAGGAGFGLAMGALIVAFRLPPFLVTLAGMFFARGMGFVASPRSLGIAHPFHSRTIARTLALPMGEHLSLPFWGSCVVLVLLAGLAVLHLTPFGRAVYAVGDDEHAARLMGVPVGRVRLGVYTIAGLCSALAGVVYTFYTQSGNPAACVGLELDAIAAVVIGGTLLSGGVGYLAGTALGVIVLGLIQTLITFQGNLSTWWSRIAVGGLLLLFLALQSFLTRGARRA